MFKDSLKCDQLGLQLVNQKTRGEIQLLSESSSLCSKVFSGLFGTNLARFNTIQPPKLKLNQSLHTLCFHLNIHVFYAVIYSLCMNTTLQSN